MNGTFRGVLFDMDGVLIDSEDVTAEAAALALANSARYATPMNSVPIGAGVRTATSDASRRRTASPLTRA